MKRNNQYIEQLIEHLLKVFMGKHEWIVVIHIVFVISGVLLALMDWVAVSTRQIKNSK